MTDPNKTFELTYELFWAGRTDRDAFTSAQYRILGVKPFCPFKEIIGLQITLDQYQAFLTARTLLKSKKHTKHTTTRIIDFANL